MPTTTISLTSPIVFVDNETPLGVVNGINRTFTLANTPKSPATLHVYVNGFRMLLGSGNDYVTSSNNLGFTVAPPAGAIITVDYRY